jgi:hypothetical protein
MFKVMYKKYQLKNKTRKQRVSNKSKKKTGGAKKSTNTSTKTRRNSKTKHKTSKKGGAALVAVNITKDPFTQDHEIRMADNDHTWECANCSNNKNDKRVMLPPGHVDEKNEPVRMSGMKVCDCKIKTR